ncbi:polysaccharide pyruvyl transferase family protein [Desulfosporosinus sp. BG]|uniref:polysaccharide pyruvyl transferase family protein n=1 Tax=Desulfosporosinus sp. BG TaxID=1633135 RepID=UPI000839E29F|nr:polysaccharide pyruvyl transferase family protein [Desulfosporosinus sp. BG]ODA40297.1 hypothetical protein DSBG_2896 [Desulfosporosinus sp. BG]
MKISVITYHRVYNYGSALQAYATIKYFERLGHEAEIIDYCPQRYLNYGSFKQIFNESQMHYDSVIKSAVVTVIKVPSYKMQKKVFDRFLGQYVPLTKTYYSEKELWEDTPIADVYCTGSDQVWNNFFIKDFERPFFLTFVPKDKKRIAYSASFGKSSLTKDELHKVEKDLQQYSAISVREQSGLDILIGIDVPIKTRVLDPTYMLIKKDWEQLANPLGEKEPFILVYQLHGDSKAAEYAVELSKVTGLKIIRLTNMLHQRMKGGSIRLLPTVNEFVSYINNAEYIVTDSFHGTSFSINLNKKFIVTYPSHFSNRLDNILNITELTDRVANSAEEAILISKKEIDYKKVNRLLTVQREITNDFMIKVLNGD